MGSGSVSYTFGSIYAGTAYTMSKDGHVALFPPTVDASEDVSVTITPQTLNLGAGESRNVTVVFNVRQGIDISEIPLVSGWVAVHSSAPADGGTFRIPYIGVLANMTAMPIFNRVDGYPCFTGTSDQKTGTNITSNGAVFTMDSTTLDYPAFNISFLFGTSVVRIDLLPGDPATTEGTTLVSGENVIG